MLQSKTFEGRTIEEALRSAAAEFGSDVEVLDASKRRSGGAFGFFTKERFVVTASSQLEQLAEAKPDFADVLMAMANEVSDTYEVPEIDEAPTPAPVVEDPRAAIEARARQAIAAATGQPTQQSIGVIDLREGKRVRTERPSVLRRRMETPAEAGETATIAHTAPTPAVALTEVVRGPLSNIVDSAPAWSMDRLREFGLPESVLATIFDFDPTSDVEWLHAVTIAIGRLLPDHNAENLNLHVGAGRGSAAELVRGIEAGLMPAYMVIDGVKVRATPDELALSIRWCLT